MVTPRIYLASSSPRRCALLDQIGASYQVLDVNVSEQLNANEVPEMYVLRLALEKARAGWAMVKNEIPLPVLGADTAVVIDDEVLGKPASYEETMTMLEKLSVTDYLTHKQLAPDKAAYVTGSDVAPCVGPRVKATVSRRECCFLGWDRCSRRSTRRARNLEPR